MNEWEIESRISGRVEAFVKTTKNAAKLVKLAVALGADPVVKKINLIKVLREQEQIGLAEAKDAIELAIELRTAA
jgi:ribosomal protein L7/L12